MKLGGLYKTEDIIKTSSDDTLSSALSLLGSSHDAVFVFDDKDKLEGVINPYYCLIRKSYPANTKVKNCLISPPHLSVSDTLGKAARQMMESKIHYLPVYQDKKFVGIITARRILRHIRDDERYNETLHHRTKKGKRLVTIKNTVQLTKAMELFKKHRVSKLVVVGTTGRLEGVLTYYDIINHLSEPRERQNFASKSGNKQPALRKPVKNFYQKNVLTMSPEKTYRDVIDVILEKEVGSIIIVDKKNIPLGIVTTKDLLMLYTDNKKTPNLKLNASGLSKGSKTLANLFMNRFYKMIGTRDDIEKAEVTISEMSKGGVFKAVLAVFQQGKRKIVKEEGKDLQTVLKDIKLKARRLLSK